MGLTTSLLPADDCTAAQAACQQMPNGGSPEVSDNILASVLFYSRNLAVPQRRQVDAPQVLKGKALFHQAGCASCHTPKFITRADAAEPELAGQTIRPYSDLLLHDMGPGLADNLSEADASGAEWRTPPLWSLGLTPGVSGGQAYLHDGRARTLEEAILWHGGEGQAAKEAFRTMSRAERDALVKFLGAL